jgi:hypothetical protein
MGLFEKAKVEAHTIWLRDIFLVELMAIVRLAPRIRHLVCILGHNLALVIDESVGRWREDRKGEVTEPMHVRNLLSFHLNLKSSFNELRRSLRMSSQPVSFRTSSIPWLSYPLKFC